MSEMQWTPEQTEALDIRGVDTLVSAAAGSGKTAVLVERVIREITDPVAPVDVDRLLVVTFTHPAARQMKQKISKALVKKIEENPSDHRLRRQLLLLDHASISTVHGFCMDFLKENFQKTELPCDFRAAESVESEMLQEETLDELFDQLYETDGDHMDLLTEWLGDRNDDLVRQLVLNCYSFLRAIPFYRIRMKKMADFSMEHIFGTPWGEALQEEFCSGLSSYGVLWKKLIRLCEDPALGVGLDNVKAALSEDLEVMDELIASCRNDQWDDFAAKLNAASFRTVKAGGNVNRELYEQIKETRNMVKGSRGILQKKYQPLFCLQTEQEMIADWKTCEAPISFLIQVIERFDDAYRSKKAKRAVIDFADMEHLTLEILSVRDENGELHPSPEALQLRSRFSEVLIDEYQDTNEVQEAIFSMLAKPSSRFMVGDIKQSIYGFRNSKPQLFLNKYNTYSHEKGGSDRRLLLSKNFRSNEGILNCCNFVFYRLMCEQFGGLNYSKDEALVFGDGYPHEAPSCDLYLLDSNDGEEDSYFEEEAKLCAGQIFRMVSEGVEISEGKEKSRPCRYSDFMILLRSDKQKAGFFAREFRRYGIPYVLQKGTSFFEAFEVKLAVSLLQIIDNPRQDIPLLAVLRSPVFGFDDDLLTMIRVNSAKTDYWDCLCEASKTQPSVAEFLRRLAGWRRAAKVLSVEELLRLLYRESGLLLYYTNRDDGAIRRDRLLLLQNWAADFERTSFRGLFHFINYLNAQMEKDNSNSPETVEGEDAVSIMSIHHSKGLEANIVFLCDCGKKFRMRDTSARFLLDDKLGFATDFVDTDLRVYYPTFVKRAIALKKNREVKSEELRLLYVAMTRAKQKLILIGSCKNTESFLGKCRSRLNGNGFETLALEQGNSYLEWLVSALIYHPDAGVLRGVSSFLMPDPDPGFSLKIMTVAPDPAEYVREDTRKTAEDTEPLAPDLEALEYRYPYLKSCSLPSKLTVTEIKQQYHTEEDEEDGWSFYPRPVREKPLPERPDFLSERTLDAAERGTAYHSAMQYLDLTCFSDPTRIAAGLDALCAEGKLNEAERAAIDPQLLGQFSATPFYEEILHASRLEREKEFLLSFPAEKLFDGGGEEELLIQGKIDCLIHTDHGILLIDYKTDRMTDPDTARSRYGVQLYLYGLAVEELYGCQPLSSWIYYIKTGEFVQIS